MDEGRIGAVKRQEDKHRKFACILNEMIKSRETEYEKSLSRERYETSFRYVKNFMSVKQSLVRQKILQQCLAMRRRAAREDDPAVQMFGQYGGVPLHGFSRDVEQHIINMHPKIRRIRKVQKLLRESKQNGAILDEDATAERINNFFKNERKQLLKVVKTETGGSENDNVSEIRREVPQKKQKSETRKTTLVKNVARSSRSESQMSDTGEIRLDKRAALVLPPIYSTKALVQR
ncbi:uncharacterized protein LOC121383055 [Gigantopelta aegis]|uniref:uncharacterized protein LOC121383055 n=1 Tax=Gigantopelta aegis TaxID=1735272 RepID=UPI001B88C2F2|nr:uncharacterized protein LOC121383055 [Gigantopelta aegis]